MGGKWRRHVLLKLIEAFIPFGTYFYVVATGGSSKRRPEFHSEGAFLYHDNPGRHPQILLRCQCHPSGQWLLTDGKNQFISPRGLQLFWFLVFTFP